MSGLAFLTPAQRKLLREGGVPVLLPRHVDPKLLVAGVQTTMRAGLTRLVALSVRVSNGVPLELLTIVRAAQLSSVSLAERGEASDRELMREYLQREATSALAMRTLELTEGAAYELTTPLDRLIAARHAELPGPHAAKLLVDGDLAPASRIAFGGHTATWVDLPAEHVALIVYGTATADVSEVVTARP